MASLLANLNLVAVTDTSDASSYVTPSVTPDPTRLILLAVNVYTTGGGTPPTISSVTGLGLTWTEINSVLWFTSGTYNGRLVVLKGTGAAPTAGAVTINLSGSANGIQYLVDSLGDSGSSHIQSAVNSTASSTAPNATFGVAATAINQSYLVSVHNLNESTGTVAVIGQTRGNETNMANSLASSVVLSAGTTLTAASWPVAAAGGAVNVEFPSSMAGPLFPLVEGALSSTGITEPDLSLYEVPLQIASFTLDTQFQLNNNMVRNSVSSPTNLITVGEDSELVTKEDAEFVWAGLGGSIYIPSFPQLDRKATSFPHAY